MLDYDTLEEFRDPITYDIECDDFADDIPVIEQWASRTGAPLLDLACGTGRMAIHMAQQGYPVTGVDVVPEMIAHAKVKAQAYDDLPLNLVVADARDFHLNQQFPFIFMLMNAFQFLQTRQHYEQLFACVHEHLTHDGYFMFETRNPNMRNLFQVRNPEGETYELPDGGTLNTLETQHYDPLTQIQHYIRHLNFRYADGHTEERQLRVALRYMFPQEIEALLHYNGFKIDTVYGNWQQQPLTADSRSMIYVVQKVL